MSIEFINLDSGSNTREDFQLRYISISKYEGDWQSLPHTPVFRAFLRSERRGCFLY